MPQNKIQASYWSKIKPKNLCATLILKLNNQKQCKLSNKGHGTFEGNHQLSVDFFAQQIIAMRHEAPHRCKVVTFQKKN